jgi:predicted RNA-binding protein with PIN domain
MQEHLMVDGNNAMHAIPSLAKELATDRNQARDSLLRLLEPLATGDHCVLTVVFDGRGGRSSLSKHANMKNYTVIHSSSSQGADGVIERMLMASKSPERIVVATNDGLIRNCAYECGAAAMRVEDLVSQLDQTIDRNANRVRNRGSGNKKQSLSFENKIPFPKNKPGK